MRALILASSVLAATALTACGNAASTPLPAADPVRYLVPLDNLPSPDFAVLTAPRDVNASTFSRNDTTLASAAARNNMTHAASVEYFRTVSSFAESNGPIDVIASAAEFDTVADASTFYAAAENAGSTSTTSVVSTGVIGDASHATVATAPDGDDVVAVQFIVTWRTANIVNVLVVRGRYGGTRLDDALDIARVQQVREQS